MLVNSVFTNLQNKFRKFLMQRKQLRALRNYSQVGRFQHSGYLNLISKCMDDSFLGEKEADFLSHLVEKYNINVLDWSYKTPWLKTQMRKMAAKQRAEKALDQLEMFEDTEALRRVPILAPSRGASTPIAAGSVPLNLIVEQQNRKYVNPWKMGRV
jgi:hypothetical protein